VTAPGPSAWTNRLPTLALTVPIPFTPEPLCDPVAPAGAAGGVTVTVSVVVADEGS
jgi:hypothetical protein